MSDFLRSIIIPSGLIVVAVASVRLRKLSWSEHVGVRRPAVQSMVLWLLIWTAWVVLVELVGPTLGMSSPWGAFQSLDPLRAAMRGVGIVLLAPIGEELVFRGLFYGFLQRSRLGTAGAILVPTVAFALMHYQYGPLEMSIVGLDGALLAVARWRSGTVLIPIAMHLAGNAFAFVQRMI